MAAVNQEDLSAWYQSKTYRKRRRSHCEEEGMGLRQGSETGRLQIPSQSLFHGLQFCLLMPRNAKINCQ